jgi:hypothetical protein
MTALEALFPRLQTGNYQVTSPADRDYNCIAWAANDNESWWWPDPADEDYWPEGVPREETLTAFLAAFATLGFLPGGDEAAEEGFEKLALFVKVGVPTHAARQLPSGRWTSKLGRAEDIEHDLRDIEGDIYGTVAVILRRPRPALAEPG